MSAVLRRTGVLAGSALTALSLVAAPASAALPPVGLLGTQVSTPAGHGLQHTRTVLTGLRGIAAAPAAKIVAKVNAITRAALVPPADGLDVTAEIDDTVKAVRADARYVTVRQSLYVYYYQGAHGESWYEPLTFDRRTGALLTLHSWAAPGQEKALLHRLSVATRAALKKRGVDPTASSYGTAAKYPNFAQFVPLPTGLLVEFGQGAVNYEAAGPMTVLVHWPTLKGLIGLPVPAKA
jgi:alkylhydroperoxidase/carboxymuconolactone decarboxylase family protein YurZ